MPEILQILGVAGISHCDDSRKIEKPLERSNIKHLYQCQGRGCLCRFPTPIQNMLPQMAITKLQRCGSRPGGGYISFQNIVWFLGMSLIIAHPPKNARILGKTCSEWHLVTEWAVETEEQRPVSRGRLPGGGEGNFGETAGEPFSESTSDSRLVGLTGTPSFWGGSTRMRRRRQGRRLL